MSRIMVEIFGSVLLKANFVERRYMFRYCNKVRNTVEYFIQYSNIYLMVVLLNKLRNKKRKKANSLIQFSAYCNLIHIPIL